MPQVNLDNIGGNPGGGSGGGMGWLKQFQESAQTIKETVQFLSGLRQQQQGGNETAALGAVANQGGGGFSVFLKMLIDHGYGDKPIGELLAEIAPLTIKQLISLGMMAGKKNGTDSKE